MTRVQVFYHVVIPPGVPPGGTFHARVGANTIAVKVPPGCAPGTKLKLSVTTDEVVQSTRLPAPVNTVKRPNRALLVPKETAAERRQHVKHAQEARRAHDAQQKEAQELREREEREAKSKQQQQALLAKREEERKQQAHIVLGRMRDPQLTPDGQISALHFLNMGI